MTGDASWPLQQAVYAALSADAGMKTLLGDPARIFDEATPDASFPFLTLGQSRQSDWHGSDQGMAHVIRLNAWSQYIGRREVKDIMSAVYEVLHDGTLIITGFNLVNMRFVFGDVFAKQDDYTWQGVMRYRAITEPV